MSAVFPRIGWFLCDKHVDAMVFYKQNRCPLCVETEERDEAVYKLEQFSQPVTTPVKAQTAAHGNETTLNEPGPCISVEKSFTEKNRKAGDCKS